jgi:Pyruvate/2-oxoacid:ferredoxin oxidoreductase delta subunit
MSELALDTTGQHNESVMIQKENFTMAPLKWKNAHPASKVEGPIRCHTCRLMCRDAATYLSHKCEIPSLSQAMARRVTATLLAV